MDQNNIYIYVKTMFCAMVRTFVLLGTQSTSNTFTRLRCPMKVSSACFQICSCTSAPIVRFLYCFIVTTVHNSLFSRNLDLEVTNFSKAVMFDGSNLLLFIFIETNFVCHNSRFTVHSCWYFKDGFLFCLSPLPQHVTFISVDRKIAHVLELFVRFVLSCGVKWCRTRLIFVLCCRYVPFLHGGRQFSVVNLKSGASTTACFYLPL